jgi:tripartite-type tricarboxylate transporter receptor subunit TctC
LNQAFSRALDSDRVKQSFSQQGLEGSSDRSPAYLAKFIKSEVDKWAKVVKQAGVQLD